MISRRTFLQAVVAGTATAGRAAGQATSPHTLYNGIVLGAPWPPRWQVPSEHPTLAPYLATPPRLIPIDVGRQLFVDDFLIEHTTMRRRHHRAAYHSGSPVLRPDRPWEMRDEVAERTGTKPNPAAMVFSDGVFFDPRDRLFKMWYMAGYGASTCLATSRDGVHWTKPVLDVIPGTNIVDQRNRDATTVWLDLLDPDGHARYKMSMWYDRRLLLFISADGVHWREIGQSAVTGDRSTFFYNAFRNVWVFSLRADQYGAPVTGRYRRYWETTTFTDVRRWEGASPVAWVKADSRDYSAPGVRTAPELYNLDAISYESVLLGLFSIWRGEPGDREKINEVTLAFSRDGFHWSRESRDAFLPVSEQHGAWNWANVQSAGGGCLIVGDQLFFYCSGRQGVPGSAAPGVCTTGLATLRRDGFASMEWLPEEDAARRVAPEGILTTRPVTFTGAHLFVNADTSGGELRVEVLDENGRVIPPFERARCAPFRGNSTRQLVTWESSSLQALAGRAVRLRFTLTRGRLYAFWVSPWSTGESRGYAAAGGPEFTGLVDTRAS